MLSDHVYNLIQQLAIESKSLKRIKDNYGKDSGDCPECKDFWERMLKDKENHIEEIMGMLREHI